jgi:hypothetical protein
MIVSIRALDCRDNGVLAWCSKTKHASRNTGVRFGVWMPVIAEAIHAIGASQYAQNIVRQIPFLKTARPHFSRVRLFSSGRLRIVNVLSLTGRPAFNVH